MGLIDSVKEGLGKVSDTAESVAGTVNKKYKEYRVKKQQREQEEDAEDHQRLKDSKSTLSDYKLEGRLERAKGRGDEKEVEKLMGMVEKRDAEKEDLIYAEKRMAAREAREEAQEARRQENIRQYKQSQGGGGFAPSDMFGVGTYGLNSDMFGVGGSGGGSDMFAIGTPQNPVDMGGRPIRARKRAPGRAPAQSQPSGYDGYYDMFGVGGMGSGGGGDMFGFNSAPVARKGTKGGHHAVGNPMAPADLFAPANVFGIGGTGGSVNNPFVSTSGSKRPFNPFEGGGFNSGANLFDFGDGPAPRKRKSTKRKTKAKRRR